MAAAAATQTDALNAPAPPPIWPTPIVGRGAELDRVVERLESVRFVSLVGPGGIGKTRLAAAAAVTLRARSGAELCWVDLVCLTESGFLVSHVAAALGLREHRGERTLVERLQATDTLLVFDNCEHVARACGALVETLLRDCVRLRAVATTRTPLGTTSESVWRVPPLAVPRCDDDDDAAALQLFALRAADVQPAFTLNAANRPAIARICRRLDGLPLAIELAAARVAVLPPDRDVYWYGSQQGKVALSDRKLEGEEAAPARPWAGCGGRGGDPAYARLREGGVGEHVVRLMMKGSPPATTSRCCGRWPIRPAYRSRR